MIKVFSQKERSIQNIKKKIDFLGTNKHIFPICEGSLIKLELFMGRGTWWAMEVSKSQTGLRD